MAAKRLAWGVILPPPLDHGKVKVHLVGERMPQELLEFYFENSRRSGGGEFKAIKKDPSKEYALITFADASGKCL